MLTAHKRDQFWRQSAFFSRMQMTPLSIDAFNQQMRFLITERASGGYPSIVSPQAPGPRPTRTGGPYEPAYIYTGEQPATGEWRRELARMVTADRQFARAAVNYIWAHFFSTGIVDPTSEGEWLLDILSAFITDTGEIYFTARTAAGTKDRLSLYRAVAR